MTQTEHKQVSSNTLLSADSTQRGDSKQTIQSGSPSEILGKGRGKSNGDEHV
jgi:hypothetical protein